MIRTALFVSGPSRLQRRGARLARHPSGNGAADRRALCGRAGASSTTSGRSSAGTSGSTFASGSSVHRSSEWPTGADDRIARNRPRRRCGARGIRCHGLHDHSSRGHVQPFRGRAHRRSHVEMDAASGRAFTLREARLIGRQVHGTTVITHRGGWEGLLRTGGRRAPCRGAGHHPHGFDRRLRPDIHCSRERSRRTPALRVAGHGQADRRFGNQRIQPARDSAGRTHDAPGPRNLRAVL